jgi:DNA invertase Pin-like site-specific DNA recombinase
MARPKCFSYIRISSDQQRAGHGIQRQMEASARYAAEHGLDLQEQLEDIGVSAWSGANVGPEGALGRFLEAVRAGRVPPNSVLVVESLDRVSRQHIRKSLGLFLSIIDLGITIVTLSDNRIYAPEKTELVDLVSSLVIMSRAYEESQTKSQRIRAAWANKRANARIKPVTAMASAWVKLSKDRTHFEVIEPRARIIRRIFEECANGLGVYSVVRRLNAEKIPSFGGGRGGWQLFYVRKVLRSRQVLGEYQPHRRVGGKRVPEGPAVEGYLPRVIDDDLFWRCQDAIAQRRKGGAGRKGSGVSNVFGTMLTCIYCGGRIRFENKGVTKRGGSYLVCDRARRGLGCQATRWKYGDFETSFLSFCSEVDLESVIHTEDDARKRTILVQAMSALRGEVAAIRQQMDSTYDLFDMAGVAKKFVADKLQKLETRRAEVEAELREKELEQQRLGSVVIEHHHDVKELIAKVRGGSGEETYKLRSMLQSRLRSLVNVVYVASLGHSPFIRKVVATEPDISADVLDHEAYHRRYFGVGFCDGTVRVVIPDRDDPLKFDVQVMGAKGGTAGVVID